MAQCVVVVVADTLDLDPDLDPEADLALLLVSDNAYEDLWKYFLCFVNRCTLLSLW